MPLRIMSHGSDGTFGNRTMRAFANHVNQVQGTSGTRATQVVPDLTLRVMSRVGMKV